MALRDKARNAGVRLASAPCNILGESIQTAWAAIRAGRIGNVRLVYAEIDDGMIHRTDFRSWRSRSGRLWPARSEFETGCTFEHAGYVITVLGAMFGPVRRVTAFASTIFKDKGLQPAMEHTAPDFSVGLLQFEGGIVARVTNSVVAPRDHRLRIFGDEGHLEIPELWDYASPVILHSLAQGRAARWLERCSLLPRRRLPHVRPMPYRTGRGDPTMDFMRGVVELARAIESGGPCRLDEDFAVHVTEVTEILQHPDRFERPAKVQSTFAPIAPMEWAMPAQHACE
jgi:predicted dehydrogenase